MIGICVFFGRVFYNKGIFFREDGLGRKSGRVSIVFVIIMGISGV